MLILDQTLLPGREVAAGLITALVTETGVASPPDRATIAELLAV